MKKNFALLLILCIFNLVVFAQTSEIKGKIINIETSRPVEGANIKLQGSNSGTISDNNGHFELKKLKAGNFKIEITHIGFSKLVKTGIIGKNERKEIKIFLEPVIYKSDVVVVTATKTPRNIEDIPGSVQVITRKQIQSIPAQKLDDIIKYASGINVYRPSGLFSSHSIVSLRGISGGEQARTLILVDGVPINKGDTGGVNWNRINKNNIERIEIFKGPGSSLYGNNAMGGVINIITRNPSEKIQGGANLSYGTYNTKNADFNLGSRINDKLYFMLSGFLTYSDGYNAIPDSLRETPDYSVDRYLQEYALSGKIGYNLNTLLNFEVQYDWYNNKHSEGEKIEAPDGEYRHYNTDFAKMKINGSRGIFSYDLNAYYQYENYFRIKESIKKDKYQRFDVDSDRKDMGMIFNSNLDISDNQTFTFGVETKLSSVNGGDYYKTSSDSIVNKGKMNILSFYAQDEISFLDEKLKLVAGLRFDHAKFHDGEYKSTDNSWAPFVPELKNHTWNAFSPRLGANYKFSKQLNSYISYSHGFRASILDDLCRSGFMQVGPKIANPNLGPESLDNFEVGSEYKLTEKISLSPVVFYSIGNDFLYFVQTGDSLWGRRPIYQRQNVTQVHIFGIELDAEYNINDNISVFANYTFNDAKIEKFDENKFLEGKQLKYTPKHQAKAGFFWQNKIVNTNIDMLYKSSQFSDDMNTSEFDGYITFDMQFSKQILKNLRAEFSIQDLLDNHTMENNYYMSPGRMLTGRLYFYF